ncbi:hypothetical protein LY78DRAFT_651823 [Colletotrichum sublineola]|nr:hypothetical protein LY78DRAFT_651823 [Colletotrichum sublineola]
MADLMRDDISIVTPSGDKRHALGYTEAYDDFLGYPAILGPTTDIIVVGAVGSDGYRPFFSSGTGTQVTVSAPGFVVCAGESKGHYQLFSGTSYAASSVAGILAAWLSQPEHKDRLQVEGKAAANVKTMVQDLAYSRVEGRPKVIWNGVDPRKDEYI